MTANDPSSPYQRQAVTQRRGAIGVCCESDMVVHGPLRPDSGHYATLLTYKFSFDPIELYSRICWVEVIFKFSSSVHGEPGPKILRLAPEHRAALQPSTRDVSVSRSGDVKAEAGQLPISLGTSYRWEKTVHSTETDEASITGTKICDGSGKPVAVSWVLHENIITKKGVPSFLRAAILLERAGNNEFQCEVAINVKADLLTRLKHPFSGTPKDEPILFDPRIPSTHRLEVSYLDDVNLHDLVYAAFSIAMRTEDPGETRSQEQDPPATHAVVSYLVP